VNIRRAAQAMILLNQALLLLSVCTELGCGYFEQGRFFHRWADRKKRFFE
jgi:hypothetical protein